MPQSRTAESTRSATSTTRSSSRGRRRRSRPAAARRRLPRSHAVRRLGLREVVAESTPACCRPPASWLPARARPRPAATRARSSWSSGSRSTRTAATRLPSLFAPDEDDSPVHVLSLRRVRAERARGGDAQSAARSSSTSSRSWSRCSRRPGAATRSSGIVELLVRAPARRAAREAALRLPGGLPREREGAPRRRARSWSTSRFGSARRRPTSSRRSSAGRSSTTPVTSRASSTLRSPSASRDWRDGSARGESASPRCRPCACASGSRTTPRPLLEAKGVQGLLEDYLGEELDRVPRTTSGTPAIALLSQMVTAAGTRNVISAEGLIERVARRTERSRASGSSGRSSASRASRSSSGASAAATSTSTRSRASSSSPGSAVAARS